MALRTAMLAALAALPALGLACGYRPAAALAGDGGRTARVPAFISFAADPELDVFAASHLATRLEAVGVRADSARGDVLIQGYLLAAREDPLAFQPDSTTAQLRVTVRVAVDDGRAPPCQTPDVEGTAPLRIPFDAPSEAERLVALRDATADAIDELVLDILLCLQGQD